MSKEWIQNIINYAIEREKEFHNFYTRAANRVTEDNLKSIFQNLAEQEVRHIDLLKRFLEGAEIEINLGNIKDYKVSETVEKPKFTDEMSFPDAVALAMKKKEEAMKLYERLATNTNNQEAKELFLDLADLEQLQKTKLEELYTSTAYPEVW